MNWQKLMEEGKAGTLGGALAVLTVVLPTQWFDYVQVPDDSGVVGLTMVALGTVYTAILRVFGYRPRQK